MVNGKVMAKAYLAQAIAVSHATFDEYISALWPSLGKGSWEFVDGVLYVSRPALGSLICKIGLLEAIAELGGPVTPDEEDALIAGATSLAPMLLEKVWPQ